MKCWAMLRPVSAPLGLIWLILIARGGRGQPENGLIGQFEEHGDVGAVLHAGSTSFDAGSASYTITGSGENMWATADAFQFVWKKAFGDVAITADLNFPTNTGNPHKKAVLMIRQSLDADSQYVDAALHLAGLTSLQARAEKGGATHEVGIEGFAATRLRLEKRGSHFYMYVARAGEELHLGGGSMRLELKEPFYIGLGVCAHDKDAVETAVFSNVSIGRPVQGKLKVHSTLETLSVSSTDRRVVGVFDGRAENPSWTADGTELIFKKHKTMEQVAATGGKPKPATAIHSNKATPGEKPSPDGQKVAWIAYDEKKPFVVVFADATLNMKNMSDGKTKVLAKLTAGKGTLSDHPWSPDGKRLVFVSYQMVPQE